MSLLIQPKRWSIKPPLGVQINYGHALASGLVEAVLFNEGGGPPHSLMRGTSATQGGTPGWDARGRTYNGAGARDLLAHRPEYQLSGAMSVAIGFINLSNDSSWHELVSRRAATGNSAIEFGLNFNAGGVSNGQQFYWNGGGSYVTIVSANATAVGTETHWVGTRSSSTAGKLYVNSSLVASGSGSAAAAGTNSLAWGAIADGNEPWSGTVLYTYLWNRELSLGEIQALYRDPYALLQPQSRRLWVPSASTFNPAWAMGCNRVIGSGYVS